MLEFINDFFNGILELLFIPYIILLVVMGILGFTGLTSPLYFISELVMLLIALIIYKSKYKGPNSFRVCWMTATMCGFWGYLFGPEIGTLIAVLIRGFMFKSMIS